MEEKCPYCKRKVHWESLPGIDESVTHECACGKKFIIRAHLNYYTEQDCTLNGKEHVWEGLGDGVFPAKTVTR